MSKFIFRGSVLFGVIASVAFGQTPDISLVVPNGVTTIVPGGGLAGEVTVEVYVDNVVSPNFLRSYQMTVEALPLTGAVGSLTLVDPTTPWPNNPSIFIDVNRADWVFAGAAAFDGVNPSLLQIGAALISTTTQVTAPKYCGTYVFHASSDASGDFQLRLVVAPPDDAVQPTLLVDQNGLAIRPLTVTPTGGIVVTVADLALNDDCASATPAADGSLLFSTDNATTDGPAHPGSGCDQAGTATLTNDVWFDYPASCSGVLSVSTCNTADFDTRIAVYDTCACPVSDAVLLTCNDNDAACSGLTSEAVVDGVVEGACYKIRVGATGNQTGSGTLRILCAPDQCADAAQVSALSSTPGSTENTTINDGAVPDCGQGVVDSPGVWYRVLGTGNLMTASLSNGTFDTRLTVYEGACGSLACVGDADNAGASQESVRWCSTFGVPYLVFVHGRGGATGTFTLGMSDASCDDGNACTTNGCSAGVCVNDPTYDVNTWCCAPATGTLTRIDDGNPCTDDVCNANGSVSHPPTADGPNAGCNDTIFCTLDECIAGNCVNTDINTLSCVNDGDCPGDTTCGDEVPGQCFCNVGPTLELIHDAGTLPVEGCFSAGDVFDVRVEMGLSDDPIVGAQFFLEYDTSTLDLLSIDPGDVADPSSVFTLEFNETHNAMLGTIDYLVGVSFGDSTRGPETVAVMTFQAVAECAAFVRYRPSGPNGEPNRLTGAGGGEILPNPVSMPPILINGSPPTLGACPADIRVPPDAGAVTATVSWAAPPSSDSCDGASAPVVCNPPSGSLFQPGTTPIVCTTTNSCGLVDSCTFDVSVEPPVVTVDMELSSVAAGPFERCITFDVWDCDGPAVAQHASVAQTLTFTNGQALGVDVFVPGGTWECITARDRLHTLSSTAPDFSTTDGINYAATFVGSRETGGHRLLSGNLNDDDYIDILDFGVLSLQHMSQASPDTPCGAPAPDANINGDNQVNLLDLVIFVGNSLKAAEPGCCGAGRPAADGPISAISVYELRRLGLDHLVPADINRDGMLDMGDVGALMNGQLPHESTGLDVRRGKSDRVRPH
jgi:hypothetical protein